MSSAAFAIVGALSGASVTALSAVFISYYQRRSAQHDEHLRRAYERHYEAYENIFMTCRSTLDSLNDYLAIEARSPQRDDPFLFQLLDIFKASAYDYCVAVEWKHNPAMGYLELALEERCLRLRDLLIRWLSVSRMTTGDLVKIRRAGLLSPISARDVMFLKPGDYQELIVERRRLTIRGSDDDRLASEIRAAAVVVIRELRAVMAY